MYRKQELNKMGTMTARKYNVQKAGIKQDGNDDRQPNIQYW